MKKYTLFLMILVACSQSPKQSDSGTAPVPSDLSWNERMSKMQNALANLVPYLYSEKRFNDPNNFDKIKSAAAELSQFAHQIDTNKKMGEIKNLDPAMAMAAQSLDSDLKRAVESLDSHHRSYARTVLKSATSYCVACHTQTNKGPAYPSLNESFVVELPPLERARYFTATRQFESALNDYMSVLKVPSVGTAFDIEKAARNALAIAVRVKKDPSLAEQITQLTANNSNTPMFIKSDLGKWQSAIREWKSEKSQVKTERDHLKTVESLLAAAAKRQRYPADISGDIDFLRASSVVHSFFQTYPNSTLSSQMLYLAGKVYEPLRDLGFWTLHEAYYEACIRKAPRTDLSKKCYERYEQSILLGYSGSAGIFVPVSVQRHLRELRGLAL